MKRGTIWPERFLAHPLWWVSCAVLILNDHLLKGTGLAPVVTGKLSDFAGLLTAPAALAVALRIGSRAGLLGVHLALGLLFVSIKTSPMLAASWEQVGTLFGWHWKVCCDPWDLLALPMLGVSWRMTAGASTSLPARAWRRLVQGTGCTIGVLACLATSMPPPRTPRLTPRYVVLDDYGDVQLLDRNDGRVRLTAQSEAETAAVFDSRVVVYSGHMVAALLVDDGGKNAWGNTIMDVRSLTACGSRVVVATGTQTLALDAATGRVLWTNPNGWTDVVCQGNVVLHTTRMLGDHVSSHRADFGANDLVTGKALWRSSSALWFSRFLPLDDATVFVSSEKYGQALSLLSGERAWAYNPPLSSPMRWATTNGIVIASDETFTVAIGPQGQELWRNHLALDVLGAGGGRLFAVDGNAMVALNAHNRERQWGYGSQITRYDYVAADADLVLMRTGYEGAIALDAKTGLERWEYRKK